MGILPVVNAIDFQGARATIEKIKTFLPEGSFVHLDVADGTMTFNRTWGDPMQWATLRPPFALEAHLMVERPERAVGDWITAGARRIIVAAEAINEDSLTAIFDACTPRGVGVALSSNPETTVDRLAPYLKYFPMFQVLSVHPGLAGQPFLPLALEKIAWLRREYPHAIIEVDGGMNAQTARAVKDAGADMIVASSYLFGNPASGAPAGDPKIAYGILKEI